MKWINSSERSPKEEGGYHIKLRGHKATMYFSGIRWETYESTDQNTIDWLDESDTSDIDELNRRAAIINQINFELTKEIDKLKGDFVYWKLEALAKQDEVNILVKSQQPFLDEIYEQQLRIKELEEGLKEIMSSISLSNFTEEYYLPREVISKLSKLLK